MWDFIASKLGFWATCIGYSILLLIITIGTLFKYEGKAPQWLFAVATYMFGGAGILSALLFLIALGITAWGG